MTDHNADAAADAQVQAIEDFIRNGWRDQFVVLGEWMHEAINERPIVQWGYRFDALIECCREAFPETWERWQREWKRSL